MQLRPVWKVVLVFTCSRMDMLGMLLARMSPARLQLLIARLIHSHCHMPCLCCNNGVIRQQQPCPCSTRASLSYKHSTPHPPGLERVLKHWQCMTTHPHPHHKAWSDAHCTRNMHSGRHTHTLPDDLWREHPGLMPTATTSTACTISVQARCRYPLLLRSRGLPLFGLSIRTGEIQFNPTHPTK